MPTNDVLPHNRWRDALALCASFTELILREAANQLAAVGLKELAAVVRVHARHGRRPKPTLEPRWRRQIMKAQ
jgi:hypothetical protein